LIPSIVITVKDDGHILPEWLAYHYEVAPLRRLIMLVDKYSITSPRHIIETYERMTDLNVTIWKEDDLKYRGPPPRKKHNETPAQFYARYLRKQITFLGQCMTTLQREARENNDTDLWAMFIDTDEYLSFNYFNRITKDGIFDKSKESFPCRTAPGRICRKDGSPYQMLDELKIKYEEQPETVASFLDRNREQLQSLNYSNCMYLPRLQHGAIELSHIPKARNDSIPQELRVEDFHTLRFPFHSGSMYWGKSIVKITDELNPALIHNPHFIQKDNCFGSSTSFKFAEPSRSFFRVHHHTGSLEDFLSRPGDLSRTVDNFQKRNSSVVKGESRDTFWWLVSFINRFGMANAMLLTQELREWALDLNERSKGNWNQSVEIA